MIFVLCPFGIDKGLVSKAASLQSTEPIHVLVPDSDAREAATYGAAVIHTVSSLPPDEGNLALWLKFLLQRWECSIILAPATIQMRCVMPMLAWYMQAGLTADCTELSIRDEKLLQTRPAFGNSLMATIQTLSPVQMATVRPGTFPAIATPCPNPEIIEEMPPTQGRMEPAEFLPYSEGIPLSQAQIIVAGGQGIGSREGFAKLEVLAQKLGGAAAASRNAVDAGFAPFRCQVGMTGVTVSPKVYIAVGISGAVQHLAGMSGAETVIAINSDPKAPIFSYADYGIVADWEAVIDKLLEELS